MSGIVAIYNRAGEPVEHDCLNRMLAAGAHRAVDGQHIWCRDNVALAHQHFWITPEEQGEEQPVLFDGGRLALTFDGRLDNRPQLLDALRLRSPDRTLTDAELTLHAYERWRHACVDRLLGDFAFAIWDGREQQLFVARDPLGVRQVCYYDDGKRGLIASTVSQILAHPDVRAKLNEGTIAEYLVGYEWNQRESHYEGVYFCPPGHCLLLTASGKRVWRYWHPDLERQLHYRDSREYVEEFRELITDAVRARLRFVGKMGISLSGGMDSTTVAALAHQELDRQGRLPPEGLSTYSYVFDDYPECDERELIRVLVEMYGLRSTYIACDNLPLLSGPDIPMISPDYILNRGSTYMPWALLRHMHQDNCKVWLTGGFGDMLYDRQFGWYWATDLLRHGQWPQLWSEMTQLGVNWGNGFSLSKTMIRPYLPEGWIGRYRTQRRIEDWRDRGISPSLCRRTNLKERVARTVVDQHSTRSGVLDQLLMSHWSAYVRFRSITADWANRLGIETWEPFRDRRLVEYALALPGYVQGVPTLQKQVLRRAMVKDLPEVILTQPNVTFLNPWFEGRFWHDEWRQVRKLLRGTPQIVSSGYVRQEWLEERLAAQGKNPGEDPFLWQVLMLEIWMQKFGHGQHEGIAVS